MRRAAPRRQLALLGACLVTLAGCAKKGPPSGGPPDIEPPRLVSAAPDSGAAAVARGGPLQLTFSEGMEPRSTGDAVTLAPPVEIRHRRWHGRTLTLVLADSLDADQTYVLLVGGGARDRHGNAIRDGAAVAFTTAATFPPGMVAGRVAGRGVAPGGAYLWGYREGRAPDSSARDFDALALADENGEFRMVGLPVPEAYRLYAFLDLNRNRSFEPGEDLLAPGDTVLGLTPEAPAVRGLVVTVLNPRAPGRLSGTVIDSLGGSGTLRLMAATVREPVRTVDQECGEGGGFQLDLAPGPWKLRGYRDANGNGRWDRSGERASPELELVVEPAGELPGIRLEVGPTPPEAAEPR